MAYLNFLLSVPETQVESLRRDETFLLVPTKITAVSHLLGYWVRSQPLGKLLGKALDGGEACNPKLWHPLRNPCCHRSSAVKILYKSISDAWKEVAQSPPKDEIYVDWVRSEISRLLPLFEHAASHNECVASVLQPPNDRERADRVCIPFRIAATSSETTKPGAEKQSATEAARGAGWPPCTWPTIASGAILGGLALCLWRYRRFLQLRKGQQRPLAESPNGDQPPADE